MTDQASQMLKELRERHQVVYEHVNQNIFASFQAYMAYGPLLDIAAAALELEKLNPFFVRDANARPCCLVCGRAIAVRSRESHFEGCAIWRLLRALDALRDVRLFGRPEL